MKSLFPLFQSHLDLAHQYWKEIILPGDLVVDATCGNGHDTLILSELVLTDTEGQVYALDIQLEAINNTRTLLAQHLPEDLIKKISFKQGCHSKFPTEISENSCKLIVYNLGYLPGGNKKFTSCCSTTIASIEAAQKLLAQGGVISITCYPGHPEGAVEEEALLNFASKLAPQVWNSCHHRFLNRQKAPSLLLLQKIL